MRYSVCFVMLLLVMTPVLSQNTANPSSYPTTNSTIAPTTNSTIAPTAYPTIAPTAYPISPTATPSSPSAEPSLATTSSPSVETSHSPAGLSTVTLYVTQVRLSFNKYSLCRELSIYLTIHTCYRSHAMLWYTMLFYSIW